MKVLEVSSHSGISLKNILLATDFSEVSAAALPYAAAISRRYGSLLHVVHILSSPTGYIVPSIPDVPVTIDSIHEAARADAHQQMEALTAPLKTLTHHAYVREGEVWEVCPKLSGPRISTC